MTPPSTASASRSNQTAAAAGATVTRLPLPDAEWAGRYDAIDLLAARLHACDCDTGSCTDTHWMAWTGQAIAALADAHIHTHHHTSGPRLVIEIDLPPGPGDGRPGSREGQRDHDCEDGPGGWCA